MDTENLHDEIGDRSGSGGRSCARVRGRSRLGAVPRLSRRRRPGRGRVGPVQASVRGFDLLALTTPAVPLAPFHRREVVVSGANTFGQTGVKGGDHSRQRPGLSGNAPICCESRTIAPRHSDAVMKRSSLVRSLHRDRPRRTEAAATSLGTTAPCRRRSRGDGHDPPVTALTRFRDISTLSHQRPPPAGVGGERQGPRFATQAYTAHPPAEVASSPGVHSYRVRLARARTQ